MGKAECEYVDIPYEEVLKLKKILDKAGKLSAKLGVHVFNDTIRKMDEKGRPLILEIINYGVWDGGDGAVYTDDDGLSRGEVIGMSDFY